jgi:molybdate transport system ATP-binding protein
VAEAVSTAPGPDTRKPWLEFALHHRQGGLTLAAEAILCASIAVLVGPSGAGKTTLLRAIAGLLRPARGRIAICGVAVYNSDRHVCLKPGRRACGMVMQRPALFPAMTARQNIAFGLASLGATERKQRMERMIALFRLGAFVDRHPWQLSGGEQQRVALARALAPEPRGLLLDEPFAGLNPELKEEILADLEAWLAARATPALYVTHDVAEAWRLAARPSAEVLRMEEGRIVAQGSAATVLGRDRERLLLALS